MVHSKMDCLCCSATCELQMCLNHQRVFNSIHKTTFGMLFYSNLCVSNVQSHSSLEPYVMPVLLVVLFTAKHDLLLLRATWRVWRVCMSCVNSEWVVCMSCVNELCVWVVWILNGRTKRQTSLCHAVSIIEWIHRSLQTWCGIWFLRTT